ncbi:hypothetical protein MIR68_008448 [Amoeboaphelidium protococcarum]|nr:hypothetical protein MIR68_008448 [Amoeboaphelidium protococcarum]KAI3644369.1 hypothetical protein MP228_010533 [Amoeboaphelidium protococcarum]
MLNITKLRSTLTLRNRGYSRFMSSVKKFTLEHEWISVDKSGKIGTIGITDYAQRALGDVVFVEVPPVGKQLEQKNVLGAVESVKAASDIYTPVSGKVVESNTELESSPSMINSDPEGEGWMAKVELSDPSQLDQLLDADAYKQHCESSED